ncbi:MAG: S-methyl-5-thioribose-1-phosphate isomerase [Gammaproteobacteria bacterium]|nr:MAG: S-methyl-5-thioribose-1-phosphate isomerase [Gammaproteobacteria bacterium]
MTPPAHDSVRAVAWDDGALRLLDQRALPQRVDYLRCTGAPAVARAIHDMAVRGAPAIGIAAAYGVALAARARYAAAPATWKQAIETDLALLLDARPTAVNLRWAVERMRAKIGALAGDPGEALLNEARAIHEADVAANRRMGELGAALIEPGSGVLTHCNTGALATGGYGTALGVIRAAYAAGKITQVYAGETRPWLQGARLTAWELAQEGMPVTLIADSAAAYLMAQGKVRWVIVGADRIAGNGDTANKIGTYSLALAARRHGVKFMVVAPLATLDTNISSGREIPIEQRPAGEILTLNGQPVAAPFATAWNPSFDITPADLIDAWVNETGVVFQPAPAKIRALAG